MPYTVYDRSLYRNGFRPYRETDTKAAASGMAGTPFDPETLHGYPFAARGGWRLHGMGSQAMPMALANPAPSTPDQIVAASIAAGSPPPSVADVCSTWDFFTDAPAWRACADRVNQAQIHTVPANAATYYGADSPTAQVAQAAAADQEAQVPADDANVADYYAAGTLIASTPSGSSGAGMPKWAFAALLVGGFLLLKNA